MEPATARSRPRISHVPAALAETVVGAVMVLALLYYAYLGRFTRYVADDYSTFFAVHLRGYWGQLAADYRLSDGHFMGAAAQDAAALLPEWFARVLPAIELGCWVAALVYALKVVVPRLAWQARVLLATTIVVTTIQVTSSPFLSFYWMTASLSYVSPLILGAVLVGLIGAPLPRRAELLVPGLLALITAGFEEPYSAAQVTAFILALGYAVWAPGRLWALPRARLIAGTVGAVAGFAIMAAAPGNAVRYATLSRITARPPLMSLPSLTINDLSRLVSQVLTDGGAAVLGVVVVAAIVAARHTDSGAASTARALQRLVVVTAGAVVVLLATLGPSEVGTGAPSPAWTHVIPTYFFLCLTAAVGWLVGLAARNVYDRYLTSRSAFHLHPAGVAMAALIVGCLAVRPQLAATVAAWNQTPVLQRYAATKDLQVSLTQAAAREGRSAVIVPSTHRLPELGVFSHRGQEMNADPTFWINQDVGLVYGVKSVSASGPPP